MNEPHSFQPTTAFQALSNADAELAPVICFSHLRWDFVFQRPQHLMSRFAKRRTVVVFEEPVAGTGAASLVTRQCPTTGVWIATPHLPEGLEAQERDATLSRLLDDLVEQRALQDAVLWYYTPMMRPFSEHLTGSAVVYDCMDELANFRFAPPELLGLEQALMASADVVFTGGYSLYEAKKHLHPRIYACPSSVDVDHFASARTGLPLPQDMQGIDGPRLGYIGVIDERLDLDLVDRLAEARPDWSIVMVGPVVKISEADLPRRANIHWLGGKSYEDLPAYLASWDVALMPFAINEATRFISPTKTPEYLASGRPVVSTHIVDVERHYGDLEAVAVARSHDAFIEACGTMLALPRPGPERMTATSPTPSKPCRAMAIRRCSSGCSTIP